MADHSTTVLESQLDWLTCSYRGADKARALRNFAMDCQSLEAKDGNRTTRWRLNGYEGFRTGRVRYGDRDNACLIQLSGQLAEDWAATLVPDATTVTRLDLQVTVRPDPPKPGYGREALADLESWYADHPMGALPSHTGDAAGGWTTYVGARRSPTFARIYNKGAECLSRDDQPGYLRYHDAWRVELEAHDAFAAPLAVAACSSPNRSAFISDYLCDYLARRGHRALWQPGSDPVYRSGSHRRSDYQTRLRWLGRAVAPAIAEMMTHGNPQEVIDALGLGPEKST